MIICDIMVKNHNDNREVRGNLDIIKKLKKLKKSVKITAAVILGILILLIVVAFSYQNKWYPNTVINGIDVSSMTCDESKKAFKQGIENYKFEVVGKDDHYFKISGSDIDLEVNYEKSLEKFYDEIKESRSFLGILGSHHYEMELEVNYNQDKLNQLLNESSLIKGKEDSTIVPSTIGHIEYDDKNNSGVIVQATVGNEIDQDKFKGLVNDSVKKLVTNIDLTDEDTYPDIYVQPAVKFSDKQLEKMLLTYNTYLLNWITWDMGEGVSESITPADIKNWLSCNNEGEVVLDKEAMSEWIESFCLKYKTVGKKRNFTTHAGNVIQISGGDYGWQLDYEKIVDQVYATITEETDSKLINAYIKNNSDSNIKALTTELEPTYKNKGYKKDYTNFENDWDTQNYTEIDLTEQKVYVYRDGQLVYNCICVSGLPTAKRDRITRTGVWYIKEKKPEKVLVGEDYETPVKYWIRIMWTGTGYHALNRSDWANWSPTLYLTKGSHGCLNLQEADAAMLYSLINLKDPVFIHE